MQLLPWDGDASDGSTPLRAGADGALAWEGEGGDQGLNPIMYLAPKGSSAKRIFLPAEGWWVWELAMDGRWVVWTASAGDNDDRWALYCWSPEQGKVIRLARLDSPLILDGIQVRGDRVLVATRGARAFDEESDNAPFGSHRPREWRLFDLRHPGKWTKLPTRGLEAQATLGANYVAWIELRNPWRIRYSRFKGRLGLELPQTVTNPDGPQKRNPVDLVAGDDRLVWGLATPESVVGIATCRLGEDRGRLVPESSDYDDVAVVGDRIVWLGACASDRLGGLYSWSESETGASVVSTSASGYEIESSSKRVAYSEQDGTGLRLVVWTPSTGVREIVWTASAQQAIHEHNLNPFVSDDRIIFGGGWYDDVSDGGSGLIYAQQR